MRLKKFLPRKVSLFNGDVAKPSTFVLKWLRHLCHLLRQLGESVLGVGRVVGGGKDCGSIGRVYGTAIFAAVHS